MYSHFEKKPSHCQEKAITTLQTIFPSINLPKFNKQSSVWEVLQKSTQNLPRPCLGDITLTISNMKTVVDSQQLKIQKNMIQIEEYQQVMASNRKLITSENVKQNYEPTGVKRRLRFEQFNDDSSQFFSKGQRNSMEDEQRFQEEIIKSQFFCEPEIDYFQQIDQTEGRHEQDFKKYLSFDL